MDRAFGALRPSMRRLIRREQVDDWLDLLRLRLDAFPGGLYQPVPGVGVRTSRRAAGCSERWRAMRPVVERLGARSAVDIGANAGYFAFALGALSIPTLAIEPQAANHRTAVLAKRRKGADNVGVLALCITPETIVLLPPADCVLCLSVWHHLVHQHGIDAATGLLEAVWRRTGRALFFETPHVAPAEFGLPPMKPSPREWQTRYLADHCPGGRVEHLGEHPASEGNPTPRHLFAVIRHNPATKSPVSP